MMQNIAPSGGKNRLSKDCAILLKSRVALYEGSWLKNFKGTAFVPNGPGWPGANKDYNANYSFKSGSIEKESEFFFDEAIKAAQIIAEKYNILTANTGVFPQTSSEPENPYFSMFCDIDMEKYNEVLLWRRYNTGLGVANEVCQYGCVGNNGVGTTKSMIDAFILKNGEPIYARCGQMKTHLIGEIIISFISLKTGIPVQTSSSKSQDRKICILRQEIMG